MRSFALIAVCAALPFGAALACGPDFPQNLLDDRKASLLELPEGTFAFEAAHLLPKPDDHLRLVEDSPWGDAAEARTKAESRGLSADESAKVVAMRAAQNTDAAAAAGAGLAPELLDYTLGAIAFKNHDMTNAAAHFERVLGLPTMQRTRRGLWAEYMLGRAQAASDDTDGALAAFAVVRERALPGADDPLGLAVASYGEQARIQWHHGNVAAAVKSYSIQAAHGSRNAGASLLFVARSVLAHQQLLDKALDDPLSQQLLAAYFYTRSNEFTMDWPLAGTRTDASDAPSDSADASAARKSSGGMDIAGFLAAVQRHGLDHFDGADRLAAGAYRSGRYPLAEQLAAKSATPMAAWVRAKLALRAGDQARALREYADAARGFPLDENWNSDSESSDAIQSPRCRVETERGVLALGRGEYLEAMARLYAGAKKHWADAAYVAERVLTIDELKSFVEKNVAAVPKQAAGGQGDSLPSSPAEQLRALLARRLLRLGRDDQALRYFDDPALRKKAAALIAVRREGTAWTRVDRAEAIFRQAQLTRSDGMQLLGAELAPDFAQWDGSYAIDAFKLQPADFIGKDEPARVRSSAAMPDQRYHYRYVAAGLAEQAASLVPPRSQAYAALMCEASAWVIDTDPQRASALYRQYLRVGAHVAWARDFGRVCPQPDFQDARWLPWKQRYWQARHWAKRTWPLGLAALGGFIVLLALRMRRNRRTR